MQLSRFHDADTQEPSSVPSDSGNGSWVETSPNSNRYQWAEKGIMRGQDGEALGHVTVIDWDYPLVLKGKVTNE